MRVWYLIFSVLLVSSLQAHELSVAVGQERWLYQEWDTWGEELDRESGYLPGVQLNALFDVAEKWQMQWAYQYHRATIDYDGQLQNGVPHQTKTAEKTKQIYIGARYHQPNYFIGAGLKREVWHRDIKPQGAVEHSLYEYYRWLGPTIELGVLKNYAAWQFLFSTEVNYLTNAKMDVDFRPFSSAYRKVTVPLPDGFSIQAQAELSYRINRRWRSYFLYEAGARYFNASNSVAMGGGSYAHEPKSRLFWSATWLGFGYHF